MLKNKVAIVTGGGSGLGEATSKLFAEHGAKVVVADFNYESAKRVAEEIFAAGGISIALKVDVSDPESVNDMVWHVIHTFGTVDILINNAGIIRDNQLTNMGYEDWDKVIATNLSSVFYCTKAVIPYMLKQGYGRIISTSSIIGRFGGFGQTNYSAAKAGILGMTGTWAREFGKKGINVNAVCPGYIKSPMTNQVPEKILDNLAQKVPMKRLGEPIEVAKVFLFLASELGDYVNGATIPVDGGLVV